MCLPDENDAFRVFQRCVKRKKSYLLSIKRGKIRLSGRQFLSDVLLKQKIKGMLLAHFGTASRAKKVATRQAKILKALLFLTQNGAQCTSFSYLIFVNKETIGTLLTYLYIRHSKRVASSLGIKCIIFQDILHPLHNRQRCKTGRYSIFFYE